MLHCPKRRNPSNPGLIFASCGQYFCIFTVIVLILFMNKVLFVCLFVCLWLACVVGGISWFLRDLLFSPVRAYDNKTAGISYRKQLWRNLSDELLHLGICLTTLLEVSDWYGGSLCQALRYSIVGTY